MVFITGTIDQSNRGEEKLPHPDFSLYHSNRLRASSCCTLWILLASILISNVYAQEPISNPLQFNLSAGRYYEERYQYGEALKWYREALKYKPDDPRILFSVAHQLIGLERLDEAYEILLRIVEIDPSDSDTFTYLAIFNQNFRDDLPAAEEYYRKAIEVNPNTLRAYQLLGDLYILQQRYPDAQQIFESLLQKKPDSYPAHLGMGSVLIKQSQLEDSITFLRKAIQLSPSEPEAYRFLGQALARQGQREEAQQYLEKYKQVKQNTLRITELIRIVRRNPTNPSNWRVLGMEYLKQKRIAEAIKAFNHCLELEPKNHLIHGLLGALYLQGKQIEKAIQHLTTAVELDSDNTDYHNNLGVCFMLKENYIEAVRAFERSIQLDAKNPQVHKNLNMAKKRLLEKNKTSNR